MCLKYRINCILYLSRVRRVAVVVGWKRERVIHVCVTDGSNPVLFISVSNMAGRRMDKVLLQQCIATCVQLAVTAFLIRPIAECTE